MYKSPYKSFLCVLFFALSICAEYNTLYLMEFENSSRDFNTDYLRKHFPELVKHKYSNRDFEISYAPNMLVSINDYESNTLRDGILLYGKFSSSYNDIIISFEAYDVETWEEKSSRTYRCERADFECIENAFYVCMDEDVISLFCDNYDCAGVCNGGAKVDCAGNCGGNTGLDCSGACNGSAYINNCGECVQLDDGSCKQDCNGVWGGNAFFNECNLCVTSELDADLGKDCFGVCGGNAKIDCYGQCNGSALPDCNGDCGGSANFNECNVCVGGMTGNYFDKGIDCNGTCFGNAVFDDCGICDGNNESCSDCSGIPDGKNYFDECGVCDSNPNNDCKQDCNNDWGGNALINECLVCVGGNTGLSIDTGLDCSKTCWGKSKLDECGLCNGKGAIYECGCTDILEGSCDCYGNFNDCLGVCGGLATIDACGVCNGDGSSCESMKDNAFGNGENTAIEISLNELLQQFNLENDPCIDCPDNSNILKQFNDIDEKKNNTDKFLYIVDEFFKDAYNVFIKEMSYESFIEDGMIKLTIPVEYSIKKDLFSTLFTDIKHSSRLNDNGTLTINLSKENYYFKKNLEDYFSLMKYQIVPVIFFMNDKNETSHIHVDSWNDNYNFKAFELKENIAVSLSTNFKPLFSITPGESNVQINLDSSVQELTYDLLLPVDDFINHEFSKMSIKFVYENELEININSYATNR